MARIRTIKPEFFTSGDITELSPLARLFYIGLWCEADREGRLRWNAKTLKLRYLPADDCDVDELQRELEQLGLIEIYEVDGKLYAEIPSFKTHQVINNREADSNIPARVEHASGTRQARVKAEGRKEGREEEDSVTNVTDADASPRDVIFGIGLKILTQRGNSEASARSFLGKYAKQDEAKLAETIAHLAANPKIEPKAYIAAALQPKQRRVVV